MLKALSLRARLTLLSALVTAGVAAALTAMSLFSADHIFVQQLPQQLILSQTTVPAEEPDGTETATPHSAEVTVRDIPESASPGEERTGAFVARSASPETAAYEIQFTLAMAGRRFSLWGVAGLFLMTLAGAGATWFMAGRALKPVRELSDTIGEIGGNDLSRRVDTHGRRDEIGRLAQSFNGMMDKVSSSFERQKRFSASAAHELKTPLATIQVGLEVLDLDEHPTPERMEKALAVARSNTDRMIRLVDDLFRLSTAEDCDMGDEAVLSDLFSEILTELAPLIREKNLSVSADAAGAVLTGSRTMLYRALFNLAENAVKYSRPGDRVTLSAADEAEEIVVRVSDTGIGIPVEELKHIFEPFYRVDRSRSRAMGGAGLGLSLVRDIVKKHGGAVEVESAPGKGTSFTLHFSKESPIPS